MRSITDVVRQFKLNWTEELSPTAIAGACRDAGMRWNDSALNPVVAIQIFFVQILHGNTAIEHLKHLTGMAFTASAYCQARMRVSLESLHFLLERCVDQMQQETFDAARWLGHRVFHLDGSSFSMPDAPELQAYFGQPGGQKPGCGFPVAHWLVMLHAGTGMIAKMLAAPLRTHDMSGTVELHPLRELRYTIHEKGFRPKEITLVTTLLDAERYALDDLAERFLQRWEIEVCQPDCTSSAHLYQLAA